MKNPQGMKASEPLRRTIGVWMKVVSGIAGLLLLSVFSYEGDRLVIPFLPVALGLGVVFLVGDWLTDRAGPAREKPTPKIRVP